MNRKQLVIMAAAALLAGSALAGDIYRYTDADGNIHYVDRPTGEASEQRVAIAANRNSTRPAPANSSRSQTSNAPEPMAAEEAASKKKTRSEIIAERKEREKKCATYRDQLETMVTSRRLYRESENGEREYLDDEQIQEARSKVQELIEENCG